MKHIFTFVTAILIQLNVFASETNVVFRQTNYFQVFELAKREKKNILLYFQFEGCGACLKMKKNVFVDKKVAEFYNSNFVCFFFLFISWNGKLASFVNIANSPSIHLFSYLLSTHELW